MRSRQEGDAVDREARFTALFEAHYDAVLRYAARRADPETARDVAAETFAVVWRRLEIVPADAAATRPWLYRTAHWVLTNQIRSHRRAERLTTRLADTSGPAQLSGDPADAMAERECVIQALARLSSQDREILRLIAWEELDLAQVAQAMGCTRSAAAVRLHRARRRLKKALEVIDHSSAAMEITGASTKVVEEMR